MRVNTPLGGSFYFMKKISQKTYLRALVIILIAIAVILALAPRQKLLNPKLPDSGTSLQIAPSAITPILKKPPQKIHSENTASLQHITLTAGTTSIQIPFSSGNTLYDALLSAKVNGVLSFSGTEYPSLGFFMTDIGTLHQGNGKYLIYLINGTEASIGVSSYVPKNGDVIVWELQ